MSTQYLSLCMQFALEVTGAERGLALDTQTSVVDQANIEAAQVQEEKFIELYRRCINEALEKGEPLITNSAITDPNMVPNTNTVLKNMRVIVVIPVETTGAVYLDATIRHGVVRREIVEALSKTFHSVPHEERAAVTLERLREIYEDMLQKV